MIYVLLLCYLEEQILIIQAVSLTLSESIYPAGNTEKESFKKL